MAFVFRCLSADQSGSVSVIRRGISSSGGGAAVAAGRRVDAEMQIHLRSPTWECRTFPIWPATRRRRRRRDVPVRTVTELCIDRRLSGCRVGLRDLT